jgi:hypothetical protein
MPQIPGHSILTTTVSNAVGTYAIKQHRTERGYKITKNAFDKTASCKLQCASHSCCFLLYFKMPSELHSLHSDVRARKDSWFLPRAADKTQQTSITTASPCAKIHTGPLKYEAHMHMLTI